MMDAADRFGEAVGRLAADPAFASFARDGAGILVWNDRADRILWASPAAHDLRRALSDASGSLDRRLAVRERLCALAGGIAPREGVRLEKLRLDPAQLAPPVTCACRLATVDSGETVLVTAIVGPVPRVPMRRPESGSRPEVLPESPASDPETVREWAPRGTVRFVWQADAASRFTDVSAELAEVVGPMAADIVGRTWDEVARSVVEDRTGAVADLFARAATYSGRPLSWQIDNLPLRVPVEWAGMPIFGRDRALAGFRGFGLIRTDAAAPADSSAVAPESGAQPVDSGNRVSSGEPIPGPATEATRVLEDAAPMDDGAAEKRGPDDGSMTAAEPVPDDTVEEAMPDEAAFVAAAEPDDVPPAPDGQADVSAAASDFDDGPSVPPSEPPDASPVESGVADGASPQATSDLSANGDMADRVSPQASSDLSANGDMADRVSPQALSDLSADGDIADRVSPQASSDLSADGDMADRVSPQASSDSEEGWFSGLRNRVAASLAGAGSSGKGEPKERAESAAPRNRSGETGGLSNVERSAFREIARALGARFDDDARSGVEAAPGPSERRQPARAVPAGGNAPAAMLDRLPVGVLIHRGGHILFANRSLLDLAGYEDIAALRDSGGFPRLFPGSPTLVDSEETGQRLPLSTRAAGSCLVDVRSGPVDWDGAPASLVMLQPLPDGDPGERLRRTEAELRERDQRVHELEAILDTATDGVIVVDETGRILSLNRSAEALFGYDQREVVGDAITVLLAPESHIVALDYLEGLRAPGVASLLNDGRDVMGRVRQGGSIPLFMTMGHVGEGPNRKFCAVLRDVTAFKKAEGELLSAKRAAEEASAQKSDLLAKISHEIRTPLNAIIGFAEVMLEERFGPVGNERYKDYLKDVHASGAHVISLVNDLLDLAKIEAGRMELAFTSVSLNELVSSCVALLQPQAARERIVMRTSFASKLPPVVADERSMRQIVLNLVSNAIKFTDAGGQVIVSTAVTDRGEVAFRVRDTGIGMTEAEVEAALEPFRQLATARKRGGTGLGLPLTKALVEANRGALQISSHPNEGTLVEVLFPPTRVLAG